MPTGTADGAPPPPPVPHWLGSTVHWASHHLGRGIRSAWSRRGAPAFFWGAVLLVTGLLVVTDSAWSFPLVVAGATLVAVGLLGPRLTLDIGLKWTPDGLSVRFDLDVDAGMREEKGETASQEVAQPAAGDGASEDAIPALRIAQPPSPPR